MLRSGRLFIYRLIAPWTPSRMFEFRARILRWCGAEVGTGTSISATTLFHGDGPLHIGSGTWIGFRSVIVSHKGGGVYIGDRVNAGQCLSIVDSTHDYGPETRRAGRSRFHEVRIGDGCWIGMNVSVLPGVCVGNGCVLAAGSVVAKNIPPNVMAAGVPAVQKRILK